MHKEKSAYAKAGVDIDAGEKAVKLMAKHIKSTHNESVLSGLGLFCGLLDITSLKDYRQPILALSIDGVGTKIKVAKMMGQFDTIGQCLVNHCVNDILTQGATPTALLDYAASDVLEPEEMEQIVKGMAIACKQNCVCIMGGETAEMPGVYCEGEKDLVAAIVGVVERKRIIDGSKIAVGDVLIGLPSNGLHTNGYSLARKALLVTRGFNVFACPNELNGVTVGKELLKIHKSYFKSLTALFESNFSIHGIAHITGGGFYNIGRLLRKGLRARIDQQWNIPAIFQMIQEIEKVHNDEMRRAFNLGIGMVLIVSSSMADAVREKLAFLGEKSIVIGTVEKGRRVRVLGKLRNVYFTY